MGLDNLLGISLEKIESDKSAIQRLISAAERNIADYSGDPVSATSMNECILQAQNLLSIVKLWFKTNADLE